MKKIIAPVAALALCSLLWAGCASKTPKAEVPPPPPPPAKAYQPLTTETQPWSDKDHVRSQSPSARAAMAEDTIARFKTAYPAAGSPTIVLFVNQQPYGDMSSGQTFGLVPSDKAAIWAVENGFIQPFIKAGAVIKHGETAMSQPAPEPLKSSGTEETKAADPIKEETLTAEPASGETPAAPSPKPAPLPGKADLVITLDVAPLPQSDTAYTVKAMAREIDSGVILGHAAGSNQMTGKIAVPTKQGYQFKGAGTSELPMDLVARGVAVDLMNSLMDKWAATAPPAAEPVSESEPQQ
jgi:hypothetical protein